MHPVQARLLNTSDWASRAIQPNTDLQKLLRCRGYQGIRACARLWRDDKTFLLYTRPTLLVTSSFDASTIGDTTSRRSESRPYANSLPVCQLDPFLAQTMVDSRRKSRLNQGIPGRRPRGKRRAEKLNPSASSDERSEASMSSDEGAEPERPFWETAEGKRKLREIEELRQLMSAAEALEAQMAGEERPKGEGSGRRIEEEQAAAEKAARLREMLAKAAVEQVERRQAAEALYARGQRAYGSGVYNKAVELFEAALEKSSQGSSLGGEIQLWLALAYDANGRRAECLALYRRLESGHALKNIRQKAAELRYIAEAPKLKLTPEEMVTIPLLDMDNNS
eukprot:TRINITY_DN3446_c0_g1_i2.p1 TRINITY_DN3446_c0_g1~~TRINITY_DN3446_c0_g1_i2.p1  ORF type:complete len:337 (-),score=42.22 TRINITY_DN3446_c0_g1_i2:34-1044(-)